MHGGDPAAAAFNMQGMAGALPTMAPNGQMTPQGGPPPPQGIPGAGAVPPPAGPPIRLDRQGLTNDLTDGLINC